MKLRLTILNTNTIKLFDIDKKSKNRTSYHLPYQQNHKTITHIYPVSYSKPNKLQPHNFTTTHLI